MPSSRPVSVKPVHLLGPREPGVVQLQYLKGIAEGRGREGEKASLVKKIFKWTQTRTLHLRNLCSSFSTRFRLYRASFAASLLPS